MWLRRFRYQLQYLSVQWLLHDSRRGARVDAAEALVTLEEQDRTLWDGAQIGEGLAVVKKALRMGRAGPYQLQAAIAALHAEAHTPAETDSPQIEPCDGTVGCATLPGCAHLISTPTPASNAPACAAATAPG